MGFLAESFNKAFQLIIGLDRDLLGIIALSLRVSGIALCLSVLFGLPLAALVAFRRFPLRVAIVGMGNTFMGLPPVVVGLLVYLAFSRSGPLGFWGLLYTPTVMILAQTVLAFPFILSLCHSAITTVDPVIRQAAAALGASPLQIGMTVMSEARYGIMSGIIAAFGRVMAEVGAVLIVGGNIAGYTRVMTTTIAMETDKGNFELALALGIILLAISLTVNTALYAIQRKGRWGAGR